MKRAKPPQLDPNDLARIQELFHGLIRSRAREGQLPIPESLPELGTMSLSAEQSWFPVPGMAGGFAYRLVRKRNKVQLIAESWCRVAEGSGMRHVITPCEIILEEEGFV